MEVRVCDEWPGGLGWITDERIPRTSHALAVGGGVWLVDPVDTPDLDERISRLGEPRGVIQLLDRHERDSPAIARRLGVPHHEVPLRSIPGAPFELVPLVRMPGWREVALWHPEGRVLVCADALGTLPYFRTPGELLGVHPFLRLLPPRALARLSPLRVLVGHGEGVHGDAAAVAVRDAVTASRRRTPAWALGLGIEAAGALAGRLRRLGVR